MLDYQDGFSTFNLCGSEENIGSQDHSSHCKIKAISELPLQKMPVSTHSAITMNMAGLQLESGGDASESNLAIILIFYFSFLFLFFFPLLKNFSIFGITE